MFKNGLVDIETGKFSRLSPRLWIHHALDFAYDSEARCPVWERFLGEVFPGDQVSQDCIEEQLGYGMTDDNRFHKGALWIGKGRNGKSTLAFIQEKLVGSTAYVGLSFHSWVSTENSGQCMIGKKVGVFPDVRFKPGKWYGQNFDPGGIDHVSKELLLKITGGDNLSLGRKYNPVWQGVLRMKVILISNEVPNLNDTVLASRFIKVAFGVSFLGREDLLMKEKLQAELPGIANRCLTAYRRLRERGLFIQPDSGSKLELDVSARSNAYAAFVQDRCVIEEGASVTCGALFYSFQNWCEENGRIDLLRTVSRANLLGRQLKENVPGLEHLKSVKPHAQKRIYPGIRLKTAAELDAEW